MEKRNTRIREELKTHGLRMWQLADLMKIHINTLTIRMRHELPEEEQNRIIDLIRQEAEKERKQS